MKKVSLLMATALCIMTVSCVNNEDKADKIIKEKMFQNLADYQSYEKIETKVVDTLTVVYDNSTIREEVAALARDILELNTRITKIEALVGAPGFLMKYKNNHLISATEYADKCKEHLSLIHEVINNFTPENCLRVHHKYRAKTQKGDALIKNTLFIIDKKSEKIVFETDSHKSHSDYQNDISTLEEFSRKLFEALEEYK
jgi:hypothetical protein